MHLLLIFASVFCLSLSNFVKSENIWISALNEIELKVQQLIPLRSKAQFYNDYYELTASLKDLNFSALWHDLDKGIADNKSCHLCSNFMDFAKTFLQDSELLKSLAHSVCKKGKFYSERACSGLITRLADPLTYILHNTKLTISEICSVLLSHECMSIYGNPMSQKVKWELPLPPKKDFKPLVGDEKRHKMLHLTDVHLDLWYTPGFNAECEEPLCCRSTTHGDNVSAGYWSETFGSCDIPLSFVEKAIKYVGNTHKDLDFVIWTGDNVPHDVWNTTEQINLRHIKNVTDIVKVAFDGIKVYPCLGNHEAHPINMYVPNEVSKKTNFSMSWLYDTLVDDYWSQWIKSESAKTTFRKFGYYSQMVNPKLKLIALNSNLCYRMNFWIAYDSYDPDGQLSWLIRELDEAETSGHYVIIIGHIPPSKDCYRAWIHNYIRISERYQHLIAGAYSGHTHKDELLVLYNKDKNNQTIPVTLNYIGPSLTTYSRLNPGYRIFTLNGDGKPLDFETYYSDVIENNKNGPNVEPKWHYEYSAKDSYKLDSLSLNSWNKLLNNTETDDNLANLYFKHYHRNSIAFEDRLENGDKLNITTKKELLEKVKFLNPFP